MISKAANEKKDITSVELTGKLSKKNNDDLLSNYYSAKKAMKN